MFICYEKVGFGILFAYTYHYQAAIRSQVGKTSLKTLPNGSFTKLPGCARLTALRLSFVSRDPIVLLRAISNLNHDE